MQDRAMVGGKLQHPDLEFAHLCMCMHKQLVMYRVYLAWIISEPISYHLYKYQYVHRYDPITRDKEVNTTCTNNITISFPTLLPVFAYTNAFSAGFKRNGKRVYHCITYLIQMIRLLSSIVQHYEGQPKESVVVRPDLDEEEESSITSESGMAFFLY